MRFVSIDIGIKSFGIFVGDVDIDIVRSKKKWYKALPKKDQYIENRHPQSNEYLTLVRDICKCIEWVTIDIYDLRNDKASKTQYTSKERKLVIDFLFNHAELIDQAEHVVIERQLTDNIKATRLAETVDTWITTRNVMRGNECPVSYVPNRYKTKRLGSPNGLTYAQRKKYTEDLCRAVAENIPVPDMVKVYELADRRYRKKMTPEKSQLFLDECGIEPTSPYYHLAHKVAFEGQKLDDCTDAYAQLVAYLIWQYVKN